MLPGLWPLQPGHLRHQLAHFPHWLAPLPCLLATLLRRTGPFPSVAWRRLPEPATLLNPTRLFPSDGSRRQPQPAISLAPCRSAARRSASILLTAISRASSAVCTASRAEAISAFFSICLLTA